MPMELILAAKSVRAVVATGNSAPSSIRAISHLKFSIPQYEETDADSGFAANEDFLTYESEINVAV